jgi:hypothetical protein
MATRSNIIIQDPETKEYTSIYCHWEGYPDGVGKTLEEFWDTPEKIQELIKLGDLSSLGETLEECSAYHRDRKDPWDTVCPVSGALLDGLIDECTEYQYLYQDGSWEILQRNTAIV